MQGFRSVPPLPALKKNLNKSVTLTLAQRVFLFPLVMADIFARYISQINSCGPLRLVYKGANLYPQTTHEQEPLTEIAGSQIARFPLVSFKIFPQLL